MRSTEALQQIGAGAGGGVASTAEVARQLQLSGEAAAKVLARLEADGLVRRVRRGLWLLNVAGDPRAVAAHLTAPYPAYISRWSALSEHGMLDQIPRAITAVSLDRAQTIQTMVGRFEISHIQPELYGGAVDDPRGFALASPEKALFDLVYLQMIQGSRHVSLVEVEPGRGFSVEAVREWCRRVPQQRLRTQLALHLERVVSEMGLRWGSDRGLG
jgi:predicted transcriptional regulator of viral defense system